MTSTSSDTVIMEVNFQNGKLVHMCISVLSTKWTGVTQNVPKLTAFCASNEMISYSENPFCGEIPQHPCPKIVEDEEVAKLKKETN